jgi:hypothetical protein
MNTSNWMKRFAAIAGSALMGLMFATIARAAVENVVAQVTFGDPVGISEVASLRFGLLDQNLALNETVIISADNPATVTDGAGRILTGTQAAADLLVTAQAGYTLSIQVTAVTPNTGYTLGSFTCNYDDDADTACQASAYTPTSVASATLWVGATLTGDGNAVPGVVNGNFDVTIAYQ